MSSSLRDWIHIPTPGDHYSPRTGSALMTVIYELTRCHDRVGGRSRIVVSEGTYPEHYEAGEVVSVPAAKPLGKAKRMTDAAWARLTSRRPFSSTTYRPAADAIPEGFEGCVFVHNGPQALPQIRTRAPGCRLYLYAHNDLFRTYRRAEAERLLSLADGVVCVSDFVRKVVAAQAPGARGKLHAVLNGVDAEGFAPRDESGQTGGHRGGAEPLVLFVGRVVPNKGADLLIDAARGLVDRGRSLRVRIVGSSGFTADGGLSGYERELRRRAEPLGERVEFVPFADRHAVRAHYWDADVMCVPSRWDEPLGLVVGEALAAGLPVVASRRGGIPEAGLDAATYFDASSSESLGEALASCLASPEALAAGRERALRRGRELDWKHRHAELSAVVAGQETRP